MPKRNYTDEQKAEALRLYHTHGPTAVTEQLGIPKGTVGRWAETAGIGTVRTAKTREATEAAEADDKHARALLTSRTLAGADKALRMLMTKVEGDPDNITARDAATIYGILADKHLALAKYDDTGQEAASAVDKWLDYMRGGTWRQHH